MNAAFVISLARREDRRKRFYDGLPPELAVRWFTAVDGKLCSPPEWWKQGRGAWGCYRSHLNLIEQALNAGTEELMIFEDDAVFPPTFMDDYARLMNSVPNDWEMLYLGGQHLKLGTKTPRHVVDGVVIPYNVNRTHAYCLRGAGIHKAYEHLTATNTWRPSHHIDHHYGRLHEARKIKVYAADPWIVGQIAGKSDVSGKLVETRFWTGAAKGPEDANVCLVLGLHRSGSSCLAGVVHRLGYYMGDRFAGCEPDGGHEYRPLAKLMERSMPFPSTRIAMPNKYVEQTLRRIIKDLRGGKRNRRAGLKYPHMCVWAPVLEQIVGPDKLKIVVADRPIETSVESLVSREKRRDPGRLRAVQEFLMQKRDAFLESTACPKFVVPYDELLRSPSQIVQRLAEFLDVTSGELVSVASEYVRPELRKFS